MELYSGFDLGGTQLKYGLVDSNGSLLTESTIESPQRTEELFPLFKTLLERLEKPKQHAIQAVGFAFPGIFLEL